jgi:transposase
MTDSDAIPETVDVIDVIDVIDVVGGVDTHSATHHAAVIDPIGRHLADAEFPADAAGHQELAVWLAAHGTVIAVGVEGTGSYGAALARHLTAAGYTVVEVDRPDRKARRTHGKSDPLDAYAAAMAVASGRAGGTPKSRTGLVESIRALHVARRGAVKARTAAINQPKALLVTAPAALREQLASLGTAELVATCTRLRPGADLTDPTAGAKKSLRAIARRWQFLDAEAAEHAADIAVLVRAANPALLALPGCGPITAAQLLISAGDNPERMKSEGAFAHLTGTAPIPASSGQTRRHRLSRGGDRQANNALHMIVITRLGHDQRTRDYAARRTAEGLSKKDIIRCLKRYVAREAYKALTSTNSQQQPAKPQPATTP